MKLAIMSLFIYLKQLGLFKVCLDAVSFFFLLNAIQVPSLGGMKGLKVKVSCAALAVHVSSSRLFQSKPELLL